jgi:hypothetical protein
LKPVGDRGEGALSYIAVILLVASVVAAIIVVAIPETVVKDIRAAVCRVAGGADCEPGAQPGPGVSPNSSPGLPSTSLPGGSTPELLEYQAAQAALAQAERDAQGVESEWNDFNLLNEIAKLGLDWLAGDIINCVKKPNLSDCIWGLLGLVPWGKIGKALKSIPKVVKLIDRFLDLKRRLEKARDARRAARSRLDKALQACQGKPDNSFPPGTPVLMADGRRTPIEQVAVGDLVWAADPETGRAGPRRVDRTIVGSGRKDLVDLRVDLDGVLGGPTSRVTATADHPFWVVGARDWIDAGQLVFGDVLTTPTGHRVSVIDSRRRTREQRVHNLTVEGLHTFYVSAGGHDLLVHNQGGPTTGACDLLARQRAKISQDIDSALRRGRHEDADNLIDQAQANADAARRAANQNPTPANRNAANAAQREVDLLRKKVVDTKIDTAMRSANEGSRLEATTAKSLRNIVRDFNRKYGPNGSLGEIDIETNKAIIEVAGGRKYTKEGQLEGLINNRTKNPTGKPVILLATRLSGKQVALARQTGAIVVRTEYELKQVLRGLGEPV